MRLLSFAVPVVVVCAIVTGCEPPAARAASEVAPPREPSRQTRADSAAPVVAGAAPRPAARLVSRAPALPKPTSSRRDESASATTAELARLGGALVVPVEGVLRSELRDSYDAPRRGHLHQAIDIPAARGTPVLSATDGRLLRLFTSKAGGLMVYATDASERFILLYGHLNEYAEGVTDGMLLRRGQIIGYVGTTGNAPPDSPHLHFGILRGQPQVSWSKGRPVNPYTLLVQGSASR